MDNWRRFIREFNKISGRLVCTEGHIYLILLYTHEKGLTGRYYLKDKLGIGEATIRNILDRLKKLGIIEALRGGHRLTAKGEKLVNNIMSRLLIIDLKTDIKPGRCNAIFIIKGVGDKVKTGVEERDNVIKYGGSGAVVLVYRDGRIIFPDSGLDAEKWYPRFRKKLTKKVELEENDVILITGGDNKISALLSGINTSLNLLG